MKRLLLATLITLCMSLTLYACAPSAEEQAESLINEGKLSEAVQEALLIPDDSSKAAMLEKVMLKAMDAQNVLDYSTLGIEDFTSFCESYSEEYISKLYSDALSFNESGKQESSFSVPQPDFKDPNYVAIVQTGDKVNDIFQSYKEIINSDVQSQLDDSAKDIDSLYRKICTNLTSMLSQTGVLDYVYSSEVLGSLSGAKKPSIDLKTLQNDVQIFTLDYNNAASALGDAVIK